MDTACDTRQEGNRNHEPREPAHTITDKHGHHTNGAAPNPRGQ